MENGWRRQLFSTLRYTGMKMLTTTQEKCLNLAGVFHWAYMRHYVLMLTGSEERNKQIEIALPALVKKRVLVTIRYGKPFIYALPRFLTLVPGSEAYYPLNLVHGLWCTEALVRFARADLNHVLYPEDYFKSNKFGVVPEWGIKYGNGSVLLFEFSTASNFYLRGNVQSKITRYTKNVYKFTEKLGKEPAVIFVLDIPRREVERFVKENNFDGQFFFTDALTFKSVPIGNQLTAPIYFWSDGGEYPLRHEPS